MALGLRPPARMRSPALFSLGTPSPADALLNYYFAAGGNDTYAQMVLGYRHMYGLGVPRSCQAAVLYYNPVAEQVIELARHPGALPQVRITRVRIRVCVPMFTNMETLAWALASCLLY
jgi:SEL1 protein